MIEVPKLSHARASLIRSLQRRKGREEEGAYLAEGERLLDELAADPSHVRFLFGSSERISWIIERFPDTPAFVIERGKGDSLFATENAQGVGAVVDIPEPLTFEGLAAAGAPLLYLDRLADPGNVGTILRTAEWFGIGGLLFGEGTVDPYNPKVVRSSMGAIFRLPMAGDITVDHLLRSGLPLVALDGGGGEYLGETELPANGIFIVGNEAHGVAPEILEHARAVAIRGSGRGESLNAGIAAGILLYAIHNRESSRIC